MYGLFRNSQTPCQQPLARLLCCFIFVVCFRNYASSAQEASPTAGAPSDESTKVENSSSDPHVDSVGAPSYIIATTSTSGLLSRTDLKSTTNDGFLDRFHVIRPVVRVPNMALVEDPTGVAEGNSLLQSIIFQFESASVRVEKVHEFAGRHLLTLAFPRAVSFARSSESPFTIFAESITSDSMDPSGWDKRSQAYLVCMTTRQFPTMWPEGATIRYPAVRQFPRFTTVYVRLEGLFVGCDVEEFRKGPWDKRVKVTDLIPLSTGQHDGANSYALLLTLSVTVPWLAERQSLASETQGDSNSGEVDFDMEIFEQEEDNLQVEKFLFEVDVDVRQPYHLAVVAGMLRETVCVLSREENTEKIHFNCPIFDRLEEKLKLFEEHRLNIRKRGNQFATAAWVSTAVAAVGIGSMIWGSRQPRKLRRALDNSLPQLLEYQFKLKQKSALSDIIRMARPSNMVGIWKVRQRNPRATAGGLAEGIGFWAFLSGLVGEAATFIGRMKTVDIEEQANNKRRANLWKRIESAAASAIEQFRRSTVSKLRVLFIVADDSA
ncbi:conserved hypothetical protein [Neospora caninum Liverpool]|uniref:Transmembrane protein n=1 Tax=Neospora caninum (strain Liverpool) TaxID=572307 RepID=F0VH23_NEOCL|nr:conserved hypothetical protein [Neospora caninum Liverpool]CBZ53017.1 conserved hypothetical protein [Neospora caninum Liverpool]|eukprot:XP_003883049.1 conserved hypothetical protein [Neospora caninum Liverpool]